jgi:polyisoprenoid-binding protein YceI
MKTLLLLPFAFAYFALPTPPIAATASTQPAPLPRGEHDWNVDTVHSSVHWKIKHAGASWSKGSFDTVTGSVTLDPKAPETGSVKLVIPTASVHSGDKKRDEHLLGPDFFNAKENPEITFTSTKIAKKGDALAVTGDLTIAGKKQSVTIDVAHVGDGDFFGKRRGYTSTFTIKRSDYGVSYGIDNGSLGDEVTLSIDLELVQPKK